MLLARYLRTLAEQNKVSSVHVNFCTKEEAAVFAQAGFHHRTGLQYHWHNNAPPAANASASTERSHTPRPYRDFDDFLGGFRSKRRLKIQRERRAVGAELEMLEVRGEAITAELLRTLTLTLALALALALTLALTLTLTRCAARRSRPSCSPSPSTCTSARSTSGCSAGST